MSYKKEDLLLLMDRIDFGSSIAEKDTLLETARVETSVFNDILNDKVDLIPGTKGSGKSALYRILVEFLPDVLLGLRKIVIAHGVDRYGDSVFHVFNDRFKKLSEDDFVSFWCIYLISLVNEQFIKGPRYSDSIKSCAHEIKKFRESCERAYIPQIKTQKTLKDILEWSLNALARISPTIKYKPPDDTGEFQLAFFEKTRTHDQPTREFKLPRYTEQIKRDLDAILTKGRLNVWLMIDKLDEIFPRRSELETKALRGLLRTMRIFASDQIRIKVFLRDDILDSIVSGEKGFTALTHITARQADTLRWSEDQILTMIVNRLFTSKELCDYLRLNSDRLKASTEYRTKAFYKVFPSTVFRGKKQSSTLRWLYNHTADGNGVVTPRDVIDLLAIALRNQHSTFKSEPSGRSEWIVGPQAIRYGMSELSNRKRSTYLKAEFPHLMKYIEKFIGGKTDYTEESLKKLFRNNWQNVIKDLRSIGLISVKGKGRPGKTIYQIPFLYRKGLELTQGRA